VLFRSMPFHPWSLDESQCSAGAAACGTLIKVFGVFL
jgi:hypothetical protein